MTERRNFLCPGLFADAAGECLHSFCSARRLCSHDAFIPLMAFCRNLFLRHKYFIAYRAMLAFCQAGRCASRCYCFILYRFVSCCRDDPAIFFYLSFTFSITEELAASIAAPVCAAARFCAGRCYCLMSCQVMAECRDLFRPGLFAGAAGECLHALCSACRFCGHDSGIPLMAFCRDHPAVLFYLSFAIFI